MRKISRIWHPFAPLENEPVALPVVESASDAVLQLKSGGKLIDAVSSWWVITHGHGHPHIQQAIASQVARLDHVLFSGFTHEPAEQLAELLEKHLHRPGNYFYFSDNGSTAVEVALKMAWQYHKNQDMPKKTILALDGAYHGDTFGSMSVGGRGIFTRPFEDLMFQTRHFPVPAENDNYDYAAWETACASEAAAFIYEPLVQGSAGMRMYPAEVLDKMLAIARRNGVLCIADEVMTGFGRTGKMLAGDYLQTKPDMICLSKGITGGVLPLGMTVISAEIADAFKGKSGERIFYHGHSFTGNPVSCAAACANMQLFDTARMSDLDRIHRQHEVFIKDIGNHAAVKAARLTGTIAAVELAAQKPGYESEMRNVLYDYFIKKGLLLRPLGNVVYILPPYCITDDQLKEIYGGMKDALRELY